MNNDIRNESSPNFRDNFSKKSDKYRKFRPGYPDELFSYLASACQEQLVAWDCATGNGQSALCLADHFESVIATDASQQQINNATQQKGVTYHVTTAEKSNIPSNIIDLITVAQAFHWFDSNAFFLEADRVLKKQGLVVIWTYNLLSIQPDIDELIYHLYSSTLNEYWFKERSMVEEGYKEVKHPLQSAYKSLKIPQFQMSTTWSLSQLTGYLSTWSAVKKYQVQTGIDPVARIYQPLLNLWGQSNDLLDICWPLGIRVWRKL